MGKPKYTSREVYSLHTRCTHSEVELRKCCLGQSEKSKIPYHLIIGVVDLIVGVVVLILGVVALIVGVVALIVGVDDGVIE